ncbi:acetoacetate--CoA ligase [Cupriavidus basilensis]|uniref:acetoacetate--CoA ligase n=1 Tax=Cupriavidus basilensis TaxID=68895 RepID=UPI0039F7234E
MVERKDDVALSNGGEAPLLVHEGDLLWAPSEPYTRDTSLARYLEWLRRERNLLFADYESLRQWSIDDIEAFWATIWDYFDVISQEPLGSVLSSREMLDARWFEGSRVNYAEHLLRAEAARPDEVVFHHSSEIRPLARTTWRELGAQVRTLATQLRALGIQPGDRVVSYMPNIPETAVAMFAAVSIGAVWSSAAPEFGVRTVVERFAQIQPKVLFAADGYRFAGKDIQRSEEVAALVAELPTLQTVVWLDYLTSGVAAPASLSNAVAWSSLMAGPEVPRESFQYERVASDHPLWILFSSGTTGLPKAILHSHVGILVEHLKIVHFHAGLEPDSVSFFYTTTGWMMWNSLLSGLLAGAAVVLYDGSPVYPSLDVLWKLAAETKATSFGASPTFVQMMEKAGLRPGAMHDLSSLRAILLGGAPSTPETFAWFYRCVNPDLWVTSQSGGTEICSAFVGGVPLLPVRAGEIQARLLGMNVHAWAEDGAELQDVVGELVVTSPFPSMPLRFWNDKDGARYREAYFTQFPGVWRHGDFIQITEYGGCYIYGRSDSTLNRHGVRIGTAEIYRAVEQVEEIADSLVVCCDLTEGQHFMPLFLKLKPGHVLSEDLRKRIATRLRDDCSPRHVPDQMIQVDEIPYTLTGKKMEVPVRKLLDGCAPEQAASRDAMANPHALDSFMRFRLVDMARGEFP